MRCRRFIAVAPLALGLALAPQVGSPAWAGPPQVVEGTFVVDPTTFTIVREDSTGPVGRLWFAFTATTSDVFGAGTFTERQDCLQRGDLLYCRGIGTGEREDGATGTFRSHVTCTLLLACEGRSVFVGTYGDGSPLVYTAEISAPGDGTGTSTATIRTG